MLSTCLPFIFLHALSATLADPQRHLAQEILDKLWHEVRGQLLTLQHQSILGRAFFPAFAFPMTQQAASLHRLGGGGGNLSNRQKQGFPGGERLCLEIILTILITSLITCQALGQALSIHNFSPCNRSANQVLLLFLFFKDERTDFEKLSNLPKNIELVSG